MVTMSKTSPPTLIEEHKGVILKALAPDHTSAIVTKDEPWTKVIIHNISRTDHTRQPRSLENLLEGIMVNSVLKGVQITQPPDWLSPEEKLTGKRAAAISFAFTDKSGKVLKNLINQPFYMF